MAGHRTDDTDVPALPADGAAARDRLILTAAALILAGVICNGWSLGWGFQYDDFVHQIVLRNLVPAEHLRPWNLYDFGTLPGPDAPLAQHGFFPWWTAADFKVRFFRPVTSLSIFLDYVVHDQWAPGYHITSLLLFAVMLTLSFRLFVDLGAPVRAALWALALLAFEDVAVFPVGWIANRNTLLATLFVVATVRAVHGYHGRREVRQLPLAMLWFLLACGSKESGLMALPLAALYLLLFRRPAAGREGPVAACRRMLRSPALWGLAVLAGAYVAGYAWAGYGTRAGLYCTPWMEPAEYGRRLAALVPLGLSSLVLGLSADLLFGKRHLVGPAVAVAVPTLLLAGGIIFRTIRVTRLSLFFAGWAVLTLLPEAGADLFDRLFFGAAVGTAGLLGLFIDRVMPIRQRWSERRYARVVLACLFVVSGVPLSILGTATRSIIWNQLAATDREIAVRADLDFPPPPGQTGIVLNCPSSMLAWSLLPTWLVTHHDATTSIFPLQFGRRAVAWTRDGERTMTLTSRAEPFLEELFERLFFGLQPAPAAGTTYETAAFTATVAEAGPGGVRAVRFEFRRDLDDPLYRFLAWQDGRLARIAPPAPGTTVEIPTVPRLHPVAP